MRRLDLLVEQVANGRPEAVALVDPARGVEITYADLARSASRIADTLGEAGIGSGDRVGLCAPKSSAGVAAILGILKAGAAYVPVDVTAPVGRSSYILKDCAVHSVLADPASAASLEATPDSGLQALGAFSDLEETGEALIRLERQGGEAEPAEPVPDDLAYVLYTSGSTGHPKGVMHTHSSALAFVDWCIDTFHPTPEDRFSSHAPFHFDLSIHDLFVSLTTGATLVLIGESAGKQPLTLGDLIAEQEITIWYSTPSILRLMVEFGKMRPEDYGSLRIVHFAGEVFPVKHLRALKAIWSEPRFFNLYGPTETNVCTYLEIPQEVPEDRTQPFPIGHACSGARCMVVDSRDEEVRTGEEGELLVAGPSVMAGYWGLPDRDRTPFLTGASGERWYRTGDLVRDLGGGCFDFLGRRDRMIKRRGYRVELGEIEAALYRHPDVSEAAVVARADEASGVRVGAFIAWTGEDPPSLIAMKRFCAEELPLYMVPDSFGFVDALPKTSTDKIDYQALSRIT